MRWSFCARGHCLGSRQGSAGPAVRAAHLLVQALCEGVLKCKYGTLGPTHPLLRLPASAGRAVAPAAWLFQKPRARPRPTQTPCPASPGQGRPQRRPAGTRLPWPPALLSRPGVWPCRSRCRQSASRGRSSTGCRLARSCPLQSRKQRQHEPGWKGAAYILLVYQRTSRPDIQVMVRHIFANTVIFTYIASQPPSQLAHHRPLT